MGATEVNGRFIQLFDRFEKLEQNVTALIIQNHNLFKLLKYEDSDPLGHTVDEQDIEDMITEYDDKNQLNPNCRVFFEPFVSEAENIQNSQLRIYPVQITPTDIYTGFLYVQADVIVHQGISKISGGRRRNRIADEVVKSLNGKEIGLVNRLMILDSPIRLRQFKKDFWGYSLLFTTGVSASG